MVLIQLVLFHYSYPFLLGYSLNCNISGYIRIYISLLVSPHACTPKGKCWGCQGQVWWASTNKGLKIKYSNAQILKYSNTQILKNWKLPLNGSDVTKNSQNTQVPEYSNSQILKYCSWKSVYQGSWRSADPSCGTLWQQDWLAGWESCAQVVDYNKHDDDHADNYIKDNNKHDDSKKTKWRLVATL